MVWVAAAVVALAGCDGKRLPDPSMVDTARIEVKKLAFEAYPSWSMAHPDKACPAKLEELLEYTALKDLDDPWGHVYEMGCGRSLPPGARGLAVWSDGPDGKSGTCDDLQSWDDQHAC
jgi:hypothetical protein